MGLVKGLWKVFSIVPTYIFGGVKKVGELLDILPTDVNQINSTISEQTSILQEQLNSINQQREILANIADHNALWQNLTSVILHLPGAILYGINAAIDYIYRGLSYLIFFGGTNVEDINPLTWLPIRNMAVIAVAMYTLIFVAYTLKFFITSNTQSAISNIRHVTTYSLHSFLMMFILPAVVLYAIILTNRLLNSIGYDADTNIAQWLHREFIADILEKTSLTELLSNKELVDKPNTDANFFPFSIYLINSHTTVHDLSRLVFFFCAAIGFSIIYIRILFTLFKNEAKIFQLFLFSPIFAILSSLPEQQRLIFLRNELLKCLIFKIYFFVSVAMFQTFLNTYTDFQFLRNNYWYDESRNVFSGDSSVIGHIANKIVYASNNSVEDAITTIRPRFSFQYFGAKCAITLALSATLLTMHRYLEEFFNEHRGNRHRCSPQTISTYNEHAFSLNEHNSDVQYTPYMPTTNTLLDAVHFPSATQIHYRDHHEIFRARKFESFRRDLKY